LRVEGLRSYAATYASGSAGGNGTEVRTTCMAKGASGRRDSPPRCQFARGNVYRHAVGRARAPLAMMRVARSSVVDIGSAFPRTFPDFAMAVVNVLNNSHCPVRGQCMRLMLCSSLVAACSGFLAPTVSPGSFRSPARCASLRKPVCLPVVIHTESLSPK
jgi:hypothetical protein